MSPRDDSLWLEDILSAISGIQSIGSASDSAEWSELEAAAIRYHLLVIGEAAAQLSEVARDRGAPPWAQIIGMRNRMTHEYFRTGRAQIAAVVGQPLEELGVLCQARLDKISRERAARSLSGSSAVNARAIARQASSASLCRALSSGIDHDDCLTTTTPRGRST